MELKTVPEMLLLLHSPNPEYKIHRVWMLELLRDGVKTTDDFEVMLNSCAYKLIMDFYTCTICDKDCKILILNIMNNTIKIPKAAKLLTEGHGLLPWLLGVITTLNHTEFDLISAVIVLINNLRCSLIAYNLNQHLLSNNVIDAQNLVLSDHTTTFLCTLVTMLSQKLTHRLSSKILIKYLKTSYYLMQYKNLFNPPAIDNLISICEKVFKQDTECKILLQTKANHAQPLKVLVNSILNSDADPYAEYGIKYLKLLIRSWLKHED